MIKMVKQEDHQNIYLGTVCKVYLPHSLHCHDKDAPSHPDILYMLVQKYPWDNRLKKIFFKVIKNIIVKAS